MSPMKVATVLSSVSILVISAYKAEPSTYPTIQCNDGRMTSDMMVYCYAFPNSITTCCQALNARNCQGTFKPDGVLFPLCANTCGFCPEAFAFAMDQRSREPTNAPTFPPSVVQIPTQFKVLQRKGSLRERQRTQEGTTQKRVTVIHLKKTTQKRREGGDSSLMLATIVVAVFTYGMSTYLLYSYFFGIQTQ